jgi:adenine phosphoribosyltransferase
VAKPGRAQKSWWNLKDMTEAETLLRIDEEKAKWLKGIVRDIPDFPKPGIIFKDITTLLQDPKALTFIIDTLAGHCAKLRPEKIAGIEARGFIFGAAVAYKLGLGFTPIRKPGKLPYQSERVLYELEYGTDSLEIHVDAVKGQRVVLLDDLLATGGTANASVELIEKVGGKVVGVGFVIELLFLSGRKKLANELDVFSMIQY